MGKKPTCVVFVAVAVVVVVVVAVIWLSKHARARVYFDFIRTRFTCCAVLWPRVDMDDDYRPDGGGGGWEWGESTSERFALNFAFFHWSSSRWAPINVRWIRLSGIRPSFVRAAFWAVDEYIFDRWFPSERPSADYFEYNSVERAKLGSPLQAKNIRYVERNRGDGTGRINTTTSSKTRTVAVDFLS